MTLTQILREEAEVTYSITEKLFRQVPNGSLSWTPPSGSNWMTMGQLLMHCAGFGCGKAIQGFVKGDWGFPDPEGQGTETHVPAAEALPSVQSVEQALELLAQDRRLTLRCIADAGEADLMARRLVAPWGGSEVSLFQHLLHVIEHLAQHKGQLFYYLKLMGQAVNTSDLWGV